jgi:hypothetical protein
MPDAQWLMRVLQWSSERVDGLPDFNLAVVHAREGGAPEKARASLVLADYALRTSGRLEEAHYRIGNAFTTFAREAAATQSAPEAIPWLAIAHRIFSELSIKNARYENSRDYCARELHALGVGDPRAMEPELRASQPNDVREADAVSPASTPTAPPELTSGSMPAPVIADGSAAAPPTLRAVAPTPPSRLAAGRTLLGIESAPPTGSMDADVDDELIAVARHWAGTGSLNPSLERLRSVVIDHIQSVPTLASQLAPLIDTDLLVLRDILGGAGAPTQADDCHARARLARQMARSQGAQSPEQHARRRWLISALWNLVLLEADWGWQSNRPQLHLDLIGYVVSIQISRRYIDKHRELSLAANEFVVRRGFEMPEIMTPFVTLWVLASAGSYLLVGGPDPILPSESTYDPRIRTPTDRAVTDTGFMRKGKEDRERWGRILLDQWLSQREVAPTAAFSIATLCGWNIDVARWLLELIYAEPSSEESRAARVEWEQLVFRTIHGAQPIRVASNPWRPQATGGGSTNLVTSDASGDLQVPEPVLKAMASELVDPEMAATVQGQVFRGRRVPTYLLSSQFGPYGVLKLDFADRVRRERENFERFARKRLHPHHRPSECRSGEFRVFVGGNEEPLQALLTTYVFGQGERPTTLTQWFRTASPDAIKRVLQSLFLGVLRPWLAHVNRQAIDLRMEYAILRPREATQDAQGPTLTARTELARLAAPEVREALGVELEARVREFSHVAADIERVHGLADAGVSTVPHLVNPLWFVGELAELGDGAFNERLYSVDNPLTSYSSMTCISHGDLHGDNVLCASADTDRPVPIIIDFETTHVGHLCRDFARLETSILAQTFDWSPSEAVALIQWMRESLGDSTFEPSLCTASESLLRATTGIAELRRIVSGCGQRLWPITGVEYSIALLASLLPVARYTVVPRTTRALAMLGSAMIATRLSDALGE